MSSKCFPLLVVSSKIQNKAIGPKLPNHYFLISAYLLLVAAWSTSQFKSRQLYNREGTESSLCILIYI